MASVSTPRAAARSSASAAAPSPARDEAATGAYWLSISDDARTLYFRDELSSLTRIAYRTGSDQPFTKFVDLPAAIVSAIPNATCDKLLYSANGTGLLDLFQASATP